jgi:predicted TIM-barrel fold metal-dependent hydrolase
MIFDAHVHFFGYEFYTFQTTLVSGEDPETILGRIRAGGLEVPGPDAEAHGARWVTELDRHGVDRAVLFASSPTEMEIVGEIAAKHPLRFVPYTVVNPKASATTDLLELLMPEYHFKGMLLFPALHDFSIQSAEAARAIDLAKRHDLVVFVHCGKLRVGVRKLVGLNADFPADKSRPSELASVARANPDVRFVVPHFGSGWFEEALELGAACRNVYTDTAGSNAWILEHDPHLSLVEAFQAARMSFGAERILFGSDSGTFPRGYRADVLRAQQETMKAAGFTADEQRAVMGENLAGLLGRV